MVIMRVECRTRADRKASNSVTTCAESFALLDIRPALFFMSRLERGIAGKNAEKFQGDRIV